MTNKNKLFIHHCAKHIRVILFTLLVFEFMSIQANAQIHTRTTFNATFVPITTGGGATVSTATGDNVNQVGIPIGFSFGYGDSTFTALGINTNGFIWFDAVAPAATAGNSNMVTTSTPNQCMSAWWNNLIEDASSDILYQTQGAPGSRTFTVQFTNYPTFTGTPGSNVRMNNQIILYETTNVIEFRYGSLNIIGGQTTSGGAMIGLEWGTGGNGKFIDAVTGSSSVSHRMLSPLSGWPSYNFRFTPGIPSTIAAGTYNVGVGQTYKSLTQAVADVNHRGITGAVTLNLTDAQYDTSTANGSNIFPVFVATPNGSPTNLLTISKTGSPATLAYRGSTISASGAGFGTGVSTIAMSHSEEPLLGVSASYTTISNVNLITHGAPQTVEIGLAIYELFGTVGAQHNMFDKISVDLDRTHGSVYGISSFSVTSPGGIAGTNSYNTFRDLNIKDCNLGFSLSGVNNATGPADYGNQIITSSCNTWNYIGNPNVPDDIISSSTHGIFVNGQNNFTIRNCIIQNITATGTSSTSGIEIVNSFGDNEISNNIIRTIRRSSTSLNSAHWISGIRVNWDNQTMNFKIFNNSISNLLSSYTGAPTTVAAVVGIYFQSTSGTVTSEIYNNSISLNGSTFPNASSICLVVLANAKTFQIKNNVFANYTSAQSGVATHFCFYTQQANFYGTVSSLSDYNLFYLADTSNGYIGQAAATYYKSLASWQAAMTLNPGTDANSLVANPNFVNNATDLHASFASTALDGTGTTPPAYITTDYDCQARTSPHDIGCDNAGCEAEAGNISPDSVTVCAQQTVVMSSTDYNNFTGTTFQWQRSTTLGGPYSDVSGGSGATTTSYTTGKLTTGTFYYVLKATCPIGSLDYSNELKVVVKSQPAASITAASDTIFCAGGSVQLNAATAANRSYQWKKGANDIAGATTASYTATSTNTFKVVVTNTQNGCTKSSNGIKVTSNPLPATTVTASGPLSFCAGDSVVLQSNTGVGLIYKWKKGTNYISGATASAYTAKTAGTYKVEITDSYGCSKLSGGKVVAVTCRENGEVLSQDIAVYPTPAYNTLTIEYPVTDRSDITILLSDIQGREVKQSQNNTIAVAGLSKTRFDISGLPAGVYIFKLVTDNYVKTGRFTKID